MSPKNPYISLSLTEPLSSIVPQREQQSPEAPSSKTKTYIERISKDKSLKKNESNLRLLYNPILDDLLEMQEREAELEAEAIKHNIEVRERLRVLAKELREKEKAEKRFRSLRVEDPNKISIM